MRRCRRVFVVGGGISGLSAAFYLRERLDRVDAEITLLEASSRWGGTIQTDHLQGFTLEAGPDSFIPQKPEALQLCRALGLEPQIIRSREQRQVYIWSNGKLRPLPRGLFPAGSVDWRSLLHSGLISRSGLLRTLLEPLIPPAGVSDESVAQFVSRRWGTEILEKIAQPLTAGVYGGDVSRLSAQSVFPQLHAIEKRRPIWRFRHPASERLGSNKGEAYFLSLKDGMGGLVDQIVERLKERICLLRETQASRVVWKDPVYEIETAGQGKWEADVVVLATPAWVSARLVADMSRPLAEILKEIPYSPAVIVCLGYVGHSIVDPSASGFLIPESEEKSLLACTFVCQKFHHRCPESQTLLRCFLAGRKAEDLMSAGEADLIAMIRRELKEILGIDPRPVLEKVYRWKAAMPQYTLGHQQRVQRLTETLESLPGLYLAGNFLDGVGIPDCIRHARRAAESITTLGTVST